MERTRAALIAILLATGFYLLLIDTATVPELVAGAVAVALAAAGYDRARKQGVAEARISLSWMRGLGGVLARLPRQLVLVCLEAVSQLITPQASRGRLRTVSFAAGAGDAADVGRRALTETLGSLTPNTIVVGIDSDQDLLLVHQLRRGGGRRELDQLGLG